MKKRILLFLLLFMAIFTYQDAFADYCKTTQTKGRSDRYLTSFSMADGKTTVSVTGLQSATTGNEPCYFDKTSSVLTTSEGAVITPAINWGGEWMHAYLWVDYNNDQIFEKDLEASGVPKANSELVSYTYYGTDLAGVDSKGVSAPPNGKPGKLSELPFIIPAGLAAGEYRARLVIAWNSLDPCGYSSMGENGGAVVDFIIKIAGAPVAERTITLKANPTVGGTVTGGGKKAGAIVCTAVPNTGYVFVNWTNEAGGAEVARTARYIDNTVGDKTLIANFVQSYPVMSYYYTGNIAQTNRYLKTVTAVQGENATTVFNATQESELPRADFPGPFNNSSSATTTGALIDKTAIPIVVDHGAASVSINFKAWTANMTLGGVAKASELNWTQQAIFVDWNNNYSFLDAGENYGKSGDVDHDDAFISAAGYTKIITIPANQPAGTYRMRVCYNEPQPSDDAWQNTLFTTLGSKTRNGKSYDFLINIYLKAFVVSVEASDATTGDVYIETKGVKTKEFSIDGTATTTLTAEAAEGYHFVSWTLNGAKVSESAVYTTTAITESRSYVANFAFTPVTPRKITVLTSNASKGSVAITSPATAGNTVTSGEIVTVVATPSGADNFFVNWTDGTGTEVSTTATYNYAKAQEVTLTANFITKYVLTIIQVPGGTIAVKSGDNVLSDGDRIAEGSPLTISITENAGKGLDQMLINGTDVYEEGKTIYSATANANMTITAVYGFPKCRLYYEYSGAGYVEVWTSDTAVEDPEATMPYSPAGTKYKKGDLIPFGGNIYLFVFPYNGNKLESLTVDGVVPDGMPDLEGYGDLELQVGASMRIEAVFSGVSTGLEASEASTSGIKVYGVQGGITINSEAAVTADVYTAGGELIATPSVSGSTTVSISSGFYIVRVNGASYKVVVK